jgi:hypothetical protein
LIAESPNQEMGRDPSDNDPISDDEYLFRRIPAWLAYVDIDRGTVSPNAFSQGKKDLEGLSFYREQFVDAKTLAMSPEHERGNYFVAKIRAAEMRKLGLTLTPNPMPPLLGHTLVPELRKDAHGGNKVIQKKLKGIRDLLLTGPLYRLHIVLFQRA